MLGIESMLKEMLGVDMDEIKVQMETAKHQAEQIVGRIIGQNDAIIEINKALLFKSTRIEKMLELLLTQNKIALPEDSATGAEEVHAEPKRIGNSDGTKH